MVTGVVSQIQRYSINDGPGIRTTVFLKGCPLRCPWCHNPETWTQEPGIYFRELKCVKCYTCKAVCPVPGAIVEGDDVYRINYELCTMCMKCVEACRYGALTKVGETLSVEEVMNEVVRDIPFYANSGGGMTVSGGEPLRQADFTAALLKASKEQGIHTCIDTSGYADFTAWEKVLPYLDLALYDIKHMDPEIHQKYTGVSNEIILENARKVASRVEVRFRVPLIPGFNDTPEFMDELGEFARSVGVHACDILPYHDYCESKYKMLGREQLFYRAKVSEDAHVSALEQQLKGHGLQTTIGG